MGNFREKLKQSGYDAEEAYFHQKDRELIQELHKKDRSHLKLLQGGKSEKTTQQPAKGSSKKAA